MMDCHDSGCEFAETKNGMRTQGGQCRCIDWSSIAPDERVKLRAFVRESRALRTALETAERERDEARAERDAWRAKAEAAMERKPKFLDARTGYYTRLTCPECGDFCRSIKPYRRDAEHPYPWFEDGDSGICQCGVSLVVKADGEKAWLEAHGRIHDALRAHASKAVR